MPIKRLYEVGGLAMALTLTACGSSSTEGPGRETAEELSPHGDSGVVSSSTSAAAGQPQTDIVLKYPGSYVFKGHTAPPALAR